MSAVAFSKEVEKLNHCSGCGREHLSQHFHVINPSDRAIVARRFPRLGQLWRAVADKTVLRLCCLWFVDGHNTRIHHLAASLARQEPLADAAPRSIRRISSISLDAHDSHDVDVSAPPPKKAKVNESQTSTPSILLNFCFIFALFERSSMSFNSVDAATVDWRARCRGTTAQRGGASETRRTQGIDITGQACRRIGAIEG
jgi:hypothetical protein